MKTVLYLYVFLCVSGIFSKRPSQPAQIMFGIYFWMYINVQHRTFCTASYLPEQSQPECWPYSPGVNWSDGVCAMASGCRTGHSAYVDWRPGTATRSHSRHYSPAGTKNTATVSVVDSSSQVSQPAGHRGRLRPLRMLVDLESCQKLSKTTM
jgi:hypothetical protein